MNTFIEYFWGFKTWKNNKTNIPRILMFGKYSYIIKYYVEIKFSSEKDDL